MSEVAIDLKVLTIPPGLKPPHGFLPNALVKIAARGEHPECEIYWDSWSYSKVVVNYGGKELFVRSKRWDSAILVVRGTDDEWYIVVVGTPSSDRKAYVYDLKMNLVATLHFGSGVTALPNYVYKVREKSTFQLTYDPKNSSLIEQRAEEADRWFTLSVKEPDLKVHYHPAAISKDVIIYYNLTDECCYDWNSERIFIYTQRPKLTPVHLHSELKIVVTLQ